MNETDLIREMFKRADVALAKNDVWQVQSANVVKHKALERLAAALKIIFDPPQILRAERDEAVILATGRINGGAVEWSIGEACVNVNYRITGKMAAYVYAMAEKRAKDRVILKLAGLHGVYSEDEADDFKNQDQESMPTRQIEADTPPLMSDLLMEVDKNLRATALKGTNALAKAWLQIDPNLKPALKAALDKSIKPIAEKADTIKAARSA
jgi:hypothetical protein